MELILNKRPLQVILRYAAASFFFLFILMVLSLGFSKTLFPPKIVYAATPSVDAITSGPVANGSITWQHTVGTSSNRLLLVTIQNSAQTGATATYNGLAMTRRRDLRDSDTVGIAQFYLLNPPSGQHAIVVNGGNRLMGNAISLYNVNQTDTFAVVTDTNRFCTASNVFCFHEFSPATTTELWFQFTAMANTDNLSWTPMNSATSMGILHSSNVYFASEYLPGVNGNIRPLWSISPNPQNNYTRAQELVTGLKLVVPAPSPTPITSNTNSFTGSVFVDTNRNGTKDVGETGYSDATVRMNNQSNGATVSGTTNTSGNYNVQMNGTGTFCISLPTVPNGYSATTIQGPTGCFTTSGSGNITSNTFDFGIASTPTATYSITGAIFDDVNKNGIKDAGETSYTGISTITAGRGTVTMNSNGTYTVSNLTAGVVTISYTSLPAGYKLTSPLNGPPPSFQVVVGPTCNTNGAQGASCQ